MKRSFPRAAACFARVLSFLLPASLIAGEHAPDAPPSLGLYQLSTGVTKETACKPGPWGKIVWREVSHEAPNDILATFALPDPKPVWAFPGWTEEQARGLFVRAGLPADFIESLMSAANHATEAGGIVFHPPLAPLEGMTPEQRAVIYKELARYAMNEFQRNPVFITTGDVDVWFRDSDLDPAKVRLFKSLCYKRGESLVFSDVSAFISHASSPAEEHAMVKAITRTRALAADLIISEAYEARLATRYWSAGGRNPDARPILIGVAESDSAARVDITRLLPPLPRRLLYTYPTKEFAAHGRLPDCHWTSLNFFNSTPEGDYLDTRQATLHVLRDFTKVQPPYELGDVLIYLDSHGDAFHSCVYVADNIVFTKNGENSIAPWILSTIEDVSKIYLIDEGSSIQGFREKEKPSTANGTSR